MIATSGSALLGSLTRNMSVTNALSPNEEDELSDREMEILVEVCRGLSNQEIADKALYIQAHRG